MRCAGSCGLAAGLAAGRGQEGGPARMQGPRTLAALRAMPASHGTFESDAWGSVHKLLAACRQRNAEEPVCSACPCAASQQLAHTEQLRHHGGGAAGGAQVDSAGGAAQAARRAAVRATGLGAGCECAAMPWLVSCARCTFFLTVFPLPLLYKCPSCPSYNAKRTLTS